jgi:hypothetical protein
MKRLPIAGSGRINAAHTVPARQVARRAEVRRSIQTNHCFHNGPNGRHQCINSFAQTRKCGIGAGCRGIRIRGDEATWA